MIAARLRHAGIAVFAVAAASVVVAGASGTAAGTSPRTLLSDPCARSRSLHVGPTSGAFFATLAPFEHFASDRTQVFASACTVRELAGAGPVAIRARKAPLTYAKPYVPATRDRNQLYVYGFRPNPQTQGGFVAGVDPVTLRQRWRTSITVPPPGQWSYPGVVAAHGNGFLYAVYGNVLVKLDPGSGHVLATRQLPENPNGSGAAYNGFVILPDGRIVAKGIERGPCSKPGTFAGLECSARNQLPTPVVVVDPDNLAILSQLTPSQSVTGRITAGRHGKTEYVYFAEHNVVVRYRYRHSDGTLHLDSRWGPVTYRKGKQTSGTGPGLLGEWLVIQTNFLLSSAPMTVTAVSVDDSRRTFHIRPFAAATRRAGRSISISKAALDAASGNVYTADSAVGELVCLHLDPRRGFTVRWRDRIRSLEFAALVGPPAHRQLVFTDYRHGGDRVVWIDARTGHVLLRSRRLAASPAPGNIVMPGFGGRFYYLGERGQLWSLQPVNAGRSASGGRSP